MDGNVVVVDGKVKTPKEYFYFNRQTHHQKVQGVHRGISETSWVAAGRGAQGQRTELSEGEELSQLASTSAATQNDSEMKGSSSMNQEKSFMSSSKSEVDSEPDVRREKKDNLKKDSKELTIDDLEKNVNILLEESPTIYTFFLPSTSYKLENEEIRKKNKEYEEYKQRLIGSDNFIARPVQTFNFQHKKIA